MKNNAGFTLIELMIVVAIIGILALIAIPNFINIRQKAYDSSAKASGRHAKLAEHLHNNDQGVGSYTSDMATLLKFDRNILDDPGVTFVFLHASESGFTLYSMHATGSGRQFTYTD